MIVQKRALVATIVALSALAAGAPAQAFTARQFTSQGQGVFVTSSGAPQNLITAGPVSRQASDGERRPLRSLEHHDRYFAGS